jgi:hypothetical protein
MTRTVTTLLAAGLVTGAGFLGAFAGPVSAAGHPAATAKHHVAVIHKTLVIKNTKWPQFVPARFSIKAGETVVLTIKNYDPGASDMKGSPYAKVTGVIGNFEKVNGKKVHAVAGNRIAHTFTVPALNLNLPIPAAPAKGPITVTATFVVHKTGDFSWQCMAPCGTGPTGWGGPMVTKGYMTGTMDVGR